MIVVNKQSHALEALHFPVFSLFLLIPDFYCEAFGLDFEIIRNTFIFSYSTGASLSVHKIMKNREGEREKDMRWS